MGSILGKKYFSAFSGYQHQKWHSLGMCVGLSIQGRWTGDVMSTVSGAIMYGFLSWFKIRLSCCVVYLDKKLCSISHLFTQVYSWVANSAMNRMGKQHTAGRWGRGGTL